MYASVAPPGFAAGQGSAAGPAAPAAPLLQPAFESRSRASERWTARHVLPALAAQPRRPMWHFLTSLHEKTYGFSQWQQRSAEAAAAAATSQADGGNGGGAERCQATGAAACSAALVVGALVRHGLCLLGAREHGGVSARANQGGLACCCACAGVVRRATACRAGLSQRGFVLTRPFRRVASNPFMIHGINTTRHACRTVPSLPPWVRPRPCLRHGGDEPTGGTCGVHPRGRAKAG